MKKTPMFKQQDKEGESYDTAETFIGPSVKLEGNFDSDGDIVVEGILTGNLSTRGDIRVGPQAIIEARVDAKNAMIAGKIKGNLAVSGNLTLRSTAIILGDIKTSGLMVEDGAVVNGKIAMKQEKNARSEATIVEEKIDREAEKE